MSLRDLAAKATPGPWEHRVWGREEDEWPDRRVSVGTTTQHGAAVCINPRYATLDQSVADAALIALAPELAVLCADMADTLSRHCYIASALERERVHLMLARFRELEARVVTARHDKATEGRTEAAAVDQAIADVRRALDTLTDASFKEADDAAMHEDSLNAYAALRVLADAVEELRADADWLQRTLDGEHEALKAAEAERDRLKGQVYALNHGRHAESVNELIDQTDLLVDERDRLARQAADLEAALLRTQAIAQRGVGLGTTPEEALETIAAYVEKRLARLAAARSRDPQAQAKPDQADLRSGQEGA